MVWWISWPHRLLLFLGRALRAHVRLINKILPTGSRHFNAPTETIVLWWWARNNQTTRRRREWKNNYRGHWSFYCIITFIFKYSLVLHKSKSHKTEQIFVPHINGLFFLPPSCPSVQTQTFLNRDYPSSVAVKYLLFARTWSGRLWENLWQGKHSLTASLCCLWPSCRNMEFNSQQQSTEPIIKKRN